MTNRLKLKTALFLTTIALTQVYAAADSDSDSDSDLQDKLENYVNNCQNEDCEAIKISVLDTVEESDLMKAVGDVDFGILDISSSDFLPSLGDFNPFRLLRRGTEKLLPSTVAPIAMTGTGWLVKQIPGMKTPYNVLKFYASTEADLKKGKGTIARILGVSVKYATKQLPGGGYLIAIADKIKPDGSLTLTEAVINVVFPTVGKVQTEQGTSELIKTLSAGFVKTVPLVGDAVIIGYKCLSRNATIPLSEHGTVAQAICDDYLAQQEFINANNLDYTAEQIEIGPKPFIDNLMESYRSDQHQLNIILKGMKEMSDKKLIEDSLTKGYLGMRILSVFHKSGLEDLIAELESRLA